MRPSALPTVLLLLLGTASFAVAAEYEVPFMLSPGQSTAVGPDGLVVGFIAITADSRCPCDALCFWEGDAEASLWAAYPGVPTHPFLLHTYAGWAQSEAFGCWLTTLIRVEPYPCLHLPPIPPAEYVVTLVVARRVPTGAEQVAWGALKGIYR